VSFSINSTSPKGSDAIAYYEEKIEERFPLIPLPQREATFVKKVSEKEAPGFH